MKFENTYLLFAPKAFDNDDDLTAKKVQSWVKNTRAHIAAVSVTVGALEDEFREGLNPATLQTQIVASDHISVLRSASRGWRRCYRPAELGLRGKEGAE